LEQQLWTGPEVDWADFGVFFPEGVEPGGWVSPSIVGPLYAERILAVNAHYLKGPLAADSPLFLRHLMRYPLGTKYGEIVSSVRSFLSREPFRRGIRYTRLLADKTGVGAAVVDGFYEKGVYPISVTIHGGSAVTEEVRGFRVPKRDLVASVQTLLQNGRLKIAPQITQRTTAGRREKARQGKVIAGRLPDYGFRYGPGRDSYEVVEEEMIVVRRIFLNSLRELR
jgi:hypothetical protein